MGKAPSEKLRGLAVKVVYWIALPFGVMQRDLAAMYRMCIAMNPLWLPVTVLLVPVVLVLWAFSRLTFVALYRGMVVIARQEAV